MATWSHDITIPSPCPEVTVTAVSQNRTPDQDAIRLYICLRIGWSLYVDPATGFCHKLITKHVKELVLKRFEQKYLIDLQLLFYYSLYFTGL